MIFDRVKNQNSFDEEKFLSVLDEKNRIISVQAKDIGSLKNEINDLKNEINCFQNKKS